VRGPFQSSIPPTAIFYGYLREHNDPGAFIGVPVVNRFSGGWAIMLTRRVSGPRGEFLGIVAGVVEARYFEGLLPSDQHRAPSRTPC